MELVRDECFAGKGPSWPNEECLASMVFIPDFMERWDGIWPVEDDSDQKIMTQTFLERRKLRRSPRAVQSWEIADY
jgi:hypothetical protein